MIMNLNLEVQLETNLNFTDKNSAIRFKESRVGEVLRYNKTTGIAKIKIINSITVRRIMKLISLKKNITNFNFLNYDLEEN